MVYLLPATIPPRKPKTPVLDVIHCVDALTLLKALPDNFVHCMITSPPYWGLRDYGVDNQLGLEDTLPEYIGALVTIFREARRVLRDDGTLWLNIGDAYAGSGKGVEGNIAKGQSFRVMQDISGGRAPAGLKPKDLMMIPARVAIALQDDGWYLRQDNIWHKPNPMPESVKDRTTTAHEHVFHFSKSERYYYDYEALLETAKYDGRKSKYFNGSPKYKTPELLAPGVSRQALHDGGADRWQMIDGKHVRNKRSVWTIPTKPFAAAHFATFPEALVKICLLAGCPKGGIVYDPFMGAGTTAVVAQKLGRRYLGTELNPEYVELANHRLQNRMEEYQANQADKPYTLHMFGETA